MKLFKTLALTAVLAASGVCNAQIYGTYIPMDPGAPGVFTNTWTFGDPAAGPGGFDDFFTFNVPDAERVTFWANAVADQTGAPTVDFNNGGYALYAIADGSVLDLQYVTSGTSSIQGDSWWLSSGTYALEIAGSAVTDGPGAYAGQIVGTLPEPTEALLAITALGAMAGAGWLRKRQR